MNTEINFSELNKKNNYFYNNPSEQGLEECLLGDIQMLEQADITYGRACLGLDQVITVLGAYSSEYSSHKNYKIVTAIEAVKTSKELEKTNRMTLSKLN